MILVDTSVWIRHLRECSERLTALLATCEVVQHPFVIGELALGHLSERQELLASLGEIPSAPLATHPEVMRLVETRKLQGRGLGWVDVHLLASALLVRDHLWTHDRALERAARQLGIAA